MMNFGYGEYITCPICRELTSNSNLRCQNCRSRLPHRNNRRGNSVSNVQRILRGQIQHNNAIHNINSNLETENRPKYRYVSPVKEELEVEKMNFALYNKGKNGDLEPITCCICLDNIIFAQHIYILSCKHIYHKNCLRKWLKENSNCPYCRKKFIITYK